jgi:hypothetical protein
MNTEDTLNTKERKPETKPLNLLQTIKSVLWAMLGIQSKENLMRDFAHGKASNFIITGILFAILFVLSLILIVNIVLSLAL